MQTITFARRQFKAQDEETHTVFTSAIKDAWEHYQTTGETDLSAVYAVIGLGMATGCIIEIA